jgi:hypothetical protein
MPEFFSPPEKELENTEQLLSLINDIDAERW